MTGRAEDCLV